MDILVAAQWTDQNGRYRAFEPCQVIPADIQPKSISIQLKSPNPEYVFTEHQPYKLFAYLENYEGKTGSGQCTNASIVQIPGTDITVEDPQLDSVSAVIRLNNTSVAQKLTCPGWRIRLRLIEQETGFESVDLTLKQPFSILPVNLRFDCASEGETPCRLIADGGTLNRVKKISIKGNTNDSDFVNVTNTLTLPKPLGENSVWIQLNNGDKLLLKDSAITLPPPANPNPN